MKKNKLKKLIREELKALIREAAGELAKETGSEDLNMETADLNPDEALQNDIAEQFENSILNEDSELAEKAEPSDETETDQAEGSDQAEEADEDDEADKTDEADEAEEDEVEEAEAEETEPAEGSNEAESAARGKTTGKEKLIRKWLKAKETEKREIIEKARLYAVARCESERVNLDGQISVFKVTPDNIREYMDQDSYQEWLFWNELVDLEMHLGEVYVKSVFGKAPIVFDTESYGAPEQEDYTARVDFLKDLEDVIELLIVYTDDEGRKLIEGKVPWIAITDPEGWKTRFLAFRPEKPEPETRQ